MPTTRTSASSHVPSSHVIVGAGAVGAGTARRLADAGHRVRLITRSGTGPTHDGIELVAADASDPIRLTELTRGANSLYNCANPPYHKWATAWPSLAASFLSAAEATGARLVTMSNLYGSAPGTMPMTATGELVPSTRKGRIRTEMWNDARRAHAEGRVRVTEARASDFVGPGLGGTSHLGDRVVPKVLAGRRVSMIGPADVIHSWTYIDDVCATLAVLGTDDRALGRAWHVPTLPARTPAEMVALLADTAGVDRVPVSRMPKALLRTAGLFVPMVRELGEILYQFDAPFVIDAQDTTDTFGLTPTPLEAQLHATVESYRSRPAVAVG